MVRAQPEAPRDSRTIQVMGAQERGKGDRMADELRSPTASDASKALDKLSRRCDRNARLSGERERLVDSIQAALHDLTDAYVVLKRAHEDPASSRAASRLALNKARGYYDDLLRKCDALNDYDNAQLTVIDRMQSSVDELKAAMRAMIAKFGGENGAPAVTSARREAPSSRAHSPRASRYRGGA